MSDRLAGALITAAGARPSSAAKPDRKALSRELARRFRSAQTDDEAAEALEAIVELARTED